MLSDSRQEDLHLQCMLLSFGVKRVAGYSVRSFLTKAITVEWAARVHRVPLDEFLKTLKTAVAAKAEAAPNGQ